MYSYPVEFTILTENRNPLTEYRKDGKTYVEGRKNSNYVLQIHNRSMDRYEVVISVDGLDIIDGEPAVSTKRGYILSPYQSIIIDGWRISDQEVRKFQFSGKSQSYSNKTKQGISNLGVIGYKLFKEYQPRVVNFGGVFYPHLPQYSFKSSDALGVYGLNSITTSSSLASKSDSSSVARSASWQGSLGTAMGEKTHSAVVTTAFMRDSSYTEEQQIYYATKRDLEKMGVITIKQEHPISFPRAFCREV